MEEDVKLLKKNNWFVECESPLEIRHKDGAFADGYAAEIILDSLQNEEYED